MGTSTFKPFRSQQPRMLPVILLLDTSGSMSSDMKIETANQAMRDMISEFRNMGPGAAEIHVAVITFGGTAQVFLDLTPAAQVNWKDMQASGGTPMGDAFKIAGEMIDDPNIINGNAFAPTIVLVSDGHPTDSWEKGLDRLELSPRAQKADRLALAIGSDQDQAMLERFVKHLEATNVFQAHDALSIKNFFRMVTMSVSKRSRGQGKP